VTEINDSELLFFFTEVAVINVCWCWWTKSTGTPKRYARNVMVNIMSRSRDHQHEVWAVLWRSLQAYSCTLYVGVCSLLDHQKPKIHPLTEPGRRVMSLFWENWIFTVGFRCCIHARIMFQIEFFFLVVFLFMLLLWHKGSLAASKLSVYRKRTGLVL